jgi:hypothetical protein
VRSPFLLLAALEPLSHRTLPIPTVVLVRVEPVRVTRLSQNLQLSCVAFLIVGIACLAVVNIILLVNIELTLRRNNRKQFSGEDEWGSG